MSFLASSLMTEDQKKALVEAFSHLISRSPKGFVIFSDSGSQVIEQVDIFGTLKPKYFGFHLPFICFNKEELEGNLKALNFSEIPEFLPGQPWKSMDVKTYYETCVKGLLENGKIE